MQSTGKAPRGSLTLVTESSQQNLIWALLENADALRIRKDALAELCAVSRSALYMWQSGRRRMRLGSALLIKGATEAMSATSESDRVLFRKHGATSRGNSFDLPHMQRLVSRMTRTLRRMTKP